MPAQLARIRQPIQRQNARQHICRIAKANRKNPNRPLTESVVWRRLMAIETIHSHVLACIKWGNRKNQYGECEGAA
ncbi:hypothetical protein GCM10011408_21400 [Dyella caseinilytica]|nr:hypothetical protein GCM10011408_21400 [Dyella caseinilytica]